MKKEVFVCENCGNRIKLSQVEFARLAFALIRVDSILRGVEGVEHPFVSVSRILDITARCCDKPDYRLL
ncbi:MAG: hypothetical protein DRO95_05360 [Candidatus Altiarchaeales archaeon]|nr:MAG: hypothetical protein DRO95_05360 [Candidatus Altiarchaeales archaeon]